MVYKDSQGNFYTVRQESNGFLIMKNGQFYMFLNSNDAVIVCALLQDLFEQLAKIQD